MPPVTFTEEFDMGIKSRGGWLGFLIFQLFATPLFFAGREASDLYAYERQGIVLPDGFLKIYIFSILLSGCLLFFSGHLLATGTRRQDALDALKYMWGGFAAIIVIPALVWSNYFQYTTGFFAASAINTFAFSFWGVIWTLYIFKSRRVRNVFIPEGGWEMSNPQSLAMETPADNQVKSASASLVDRTPVNVTAAKDLVTVQETPSAELEGSVSISMEERLWGKAIREFEENRRPGLWAKSFAKAKGNEALAKASYLEERVQELTAHHEALILKKSELKKAEEHAAREMEEERQRRAYEIAPKGRCPVCKTTVLITSKRCNRCSAIFGEGSNYHLEPVEG